MEIQESGLVTAKVKYPSQLKPTMKEDIKLPSRWIVHIPKTRPVFKKWKGKKVPRKETYGNKSVLSYKGKLTHTAKNIEQTIGRRTKLIFHQNSNGC